MESRFDFTHAKRLFIAIPLPDEVKKEIHYALDRIDHEIFSYGREVREDQWHITLSFLGDQDGKFISDVIVVIREAMQMFKDSRISITFKHIDFESVDKRMMWAHGTKESSEKLEKIKEYISHRLSDKHIHPQDSFQKFTLHTTLMRFSRRPPSDLRIHEEIEVSFPLEKIDLMESKLSHEGPDYTILHSEDIK